MTTPPEPGQDSPLAAMITNWRDGNADRDQVELALHRAALDRGATWVQIGQLTGISGKEAKRRSHKLAERTRRAKAAAVEDAGYEALRGLLPQCRHLPWVPSRRITHQTSRCQQILTGNARTATTPRARISSGVRFMITNSCHRLAVTRLPRLAATADPPRGRSPRR